jgi:hypothetical protein
MTFNNPSRHSLLRSSKQPYSAIIRYQLALATAQLTPLAYAVRIVAGDGHLHSCDELCRQLLFQSTVDRGSPVPCRHEPGSQLKKASLSFPRGDARNTVCVATCWARRSQMGLSRGGVGGEAQWVVGERVIVLHARPSAKRWS